MITYHNSAENIAADQLQGFFVGWPEPPAPDAHLRILRGSDYVGLALNEETERVVGFVTAISDGVLAAYIPLLEVLPSWQGRKIGSTLMTQMLNTLSNFYMIDLLCKTETQPFYEQVGMVKARGMIVRHYERQSCTG